ncbi:hypothetical protein Pyrde_0071 [Pyrodictium delaneyi]|uniref:Uncharacterized protein n=1 Tax=Pyrodictium delaneyi TaxID=1273541 RepID=A0A0N7JCR4_9CREN|nr:hypothetical protein Pyrde_0071 [Pyrodictium delaneyi]
MYAAVLLLGLALGFAAGQFTAQPKEIVRETVLTTTVTETVTETVTVTPPKPRIECRPLRVLYSNTSLTLGVYLVEEKSNVSGISLPTIKKKRDVIRLSFEGGGEGQRLHIHIDAYPSQLRWLSIELYNPADLLAYVAMPKSKDIVFSIPYPDNYTLVIEPQSTVKLYNVTVWIEECQQQ